MFEKKLVRLDSDDDLVGGYVFVFPASEIQDPFFELSFIVEGVECKGKQEKCEDHAEIKKRMISFLHLWR